CTLDSLTRNGQNAILLQEELIAEALGRYSAFLTKLGINPPHRWIAGLQGVKDRGIIIPRCPGTISLNPGPRGICLIDNPINGSWLVCIWRESPHYQEHDARTF